MNKGMGDRAARHAEFLDWRGVEDPCKRCDGSGAVVYGSTSMWRGGIGGAAMTRGVCDLCWGSGDASRPWADLRSYERTLTTKAAELAIDALCRAAGVRLGQAAVLTLIVEIRKIGATRRGHAAPVRAIANALANTLNAGVTSVMLERDPSA